MARECGFHLGPDERQQGQHVHTAHALPFGRGHGDFGFAQAQAAAAEVTGEHPAGRPVEQAGHVIDAEFMLANARPGGFDTLPARGQLERQARDQLNAILLIETRSRHQVFTAQ